MHKILYKGQPSLWSEMMQTLDGIEPRSPQRNIMTQTVCTGTVLDEHIIVMSQFNGPTSPGHCLTGMISILWPLRCHPYTA